MTDLIGRLAAYGADMDAALERFVGDEELYADCFRLFLEDPSFPALDGAMARRDYAAAFDAAHALKGVSGNLGLTPLFNAVCALVEPLRRGEYGGLAELYQAVLDARAAVERLGDEPA